MTLDERFNKLREKLKEMDRVIVAFSGGVDSAFLLKAASMSGLSDVLAVTGVSDSIPGEELSFAKEIASSLKIEHMTIITEELKDKNYAENPPDRCYYCKKELFSKLRDIAGKKHYPFILDGTNADDERDWRPGSRAAREESVQSPLRDAGLTKQEIRELSQRLGLPSWNKPATPCLSSRFPYGHAITAKALSRVHQAEVFLKNMGIGECRVRDHSPIARIEVHPDDFRTLIDDTGRLRIISFFKSIGYQHVTLDLQGFRSGSANEVLHKNNDQ